ncbi:MAG TPA: hypothetical protein VF665_05500 [Longimicrobium sp.]|jgi:hypothetical protein|uniref:hypothetical protein n=1 Tax=Longimicrobium sp. TaxID=2029185 RepID=UPI002ED9094B
MMMSAAEFFVRKQSPRQGTCFVLMPFTDALTSVYEHGIKPAVEQMGMQCKRADELYTTQGILGDVWEAIQSAEIVIADLTGKNANVMYELGLCHALWKRVVLLSQNRDDIPFDLRQWRVIWYDFSFSGAARLKDDLHRAITALRQEQVTESEMIPLKSVRVPGHIVSHPAQSPYSPTSSSFPPKNESEWLHGEITTWKADEHYGFIRSGTEDFFFTAHGLFAEDMNVREGAPVIFTPADPYPGKRNRRALKVFVHGYEMRGRVSRAPTPDGRYGFAEIEGQRKERHSLFFIPKLGERIERGEIVECTICDSPKGPVGKDAHVVTARASAASVSSVDVDADGEIEEELI